MNISNESGTIYFDRLSKAVRKKADGSITNLIGDDKTETSTVLLRITNDFERRINDADFDYGDGATIGIRLTSSLSSIKCMEARIDNDIEHISSCGKIITIPFRCKVQNLNLRFFSLTFFDAPSALLFCNTYRRYLPRKKLTHQPLRFSYHDLVKRSKEVDEYSVRRRLKEGKSEENVGEEEEVKKEEEAEKEEEEEVLSDGDLAEGDEPRRKRKRLDPQQSEEDPNKQLTELFLDEQFGYSQTWC